MILNMVRRKGKIFESHLKIVVTHCLSRFKARHSIFLSLIMKGKSFFLRSLSKFLIFDIAICNEPRKKKSWNSNFSDGFEI